MEWRSLAELPDYEVSETGEVRRIGGPLLKGVVTRKGYHRYCLMQNKKQRSFFAHRLACRAFNGPPPKGLTQVAHRDGDKLNNHFGNLRWATAAENEADKVLHGTDHAGERNPSAKLTWAAVRSIRQSYHGEPGGMARLAREYGVALQTVWKILTGLTWKVAA